MHGEAGVGKTRLVAELTELAGHTGGLTAIGTTPTIGCPPYWPWAELGSALLRGLHDRARPAAAYTDPAGRTRPARFRTGPAHRGIAGPADVRGSSGAGAGGSRGHARL